MNPRISLTATIAVSVAFAVAACAPADSMPQPSGSSSALPAQVPALHPADGSQVCPRPQVGVDLILTDATRKDGAFDPSTVTLTLDGVDVTAAAATRTNLTSPASRVTILVTPDADLSFGQHTAALTYATASGPATVTWQFTALAIACGQ